MAKFSTVNNGWQYLTLHLWVIITHKDLKSLFIYFYTVYNFVLILGLLYFVNLNVYNLIFNISYYLIFLLGFTAIIIYNIVKIIYFIRNIDKIINNYINPRY